MILTVLALAAAAPACRTYDANLPRPLAGWRKAGRGLDTGHAVLLDAGRDRAVSTTLTIRKAGTFGIALDQPGWVAVTPAGGAPLRSAADGKGPRCSTIAKIVRYKLRPGTYRVRVSRLRADRARLMLVRYSSRERT